MFWCSGKLYIATIYIYIICLILTFGKVEDISQAYSQLIGFLDESITFCRSVFKQKQNRQSCNCILLKTRGRNTIVGSN